MAKTLSFLKESTPFARTLPTMLAERSSWTLTSGPLPPATEAERPTKAADDASLKWVARSADGKAELHQEGNAQGGCNLTCSWGTDGRWWFIEAGPASCAGTGHEAVFKAVARRLQGEKVDLQSDRVGGPF